MAVQWLAGDGAVVAAGRHLLDASPWSLSEVVMCVCGRRTDGCPVKGSSTGFRNRKNPFELTLLHSHLLTKSFGQKCREREMTPRDRDANQKAR